MHERYSIDTADPAVMFGRSWFWLRDRIGALLAVPPAFAIEGDKKRVLIPATRLQWAFHTELQRQG